MPATVFRIQPPVRIHFCPVAGYADWYRGLLLSDKAREKTMYRYAARLLGLET